MSALDPKRTLAEISTVLPPRPLWTLLLPSPVILAVAVLAMKMLTVPLMLRKSPLSETLYVGLAALIAQ